jgi:AcrR family transcriptional regulator
MPPVITDQGPGADGTAGPAETRRPGRPRSEQAEQAIIEATLDLFAEQGFDGVCVEAVASRAGVGKATIYRRWPNKEELLLAALSSLKSPYPEPKGVSVRDDLVAMLSVMCADMADPRKARRYALLLGEGERYPRLMARYKETVVQPRRELMRSVIRRGMASGELRADIDVEIAVLALTGTVLAKGKETDARLDGDLAARIVDELMLGLAARPEPGAARREPGAAGPELS